VAEYILLAIIASSLNKNFENYREKEIKQIENP